MDFIFTSYYIELRKLYEKIIKLPRSRENRCEVKTISLSSKKTSSSHSHSEFIRFGNFNKSEISEISLSN